MSRINIRYYRAHPPGKARELSPAAYITWHGMTPEQQEDLKQWAKEMNAVLLDFTERAGAALLPFVEKIGQILQNYEAPTAEICNDASKFVNMWNARLEKLYNSSDKKIRK